MCLFLCVDSTFQVSLTHPPETRQAHHYERLLDHQSGLFLTTNLLRPVRGRSTYPRPNIWSRQLGGTCLSCHAECKGGCWGPTNAHCTRCAHFRVWSSDTTEQSSLWKAPWDENVYQLNKREEPELPPEYYKVMPNSSSVLARSQNVETADHLCDMIGQQISLGKVEQSRALFIQYNVSIISGSRSPLHM